MAGMDDWKVVPRKDGIGGQIFIRMELLTPLQKATKQSMLSESEVIRLGKNICKALMLCEARHIIREAEADRAEGMSAICIYCFGGVAYLIRELLKTK